MARRLFYSYADEDGALRDELAKHLEPLHRDGLIDAWHRAGAGEERGRRAEEELQRADVILVLLSPDYLASAALEEEQLRPALRRREAGQARVIPVLLRPVEWQRSLVAKLAPLPKDGRAVTSWENPDEAWRDVVRGVREVVESLPPPDSITAPTPGTPDPQPRSSPTFFELKRELEALISRAPSKGTVDRFTEIVGAQAPLHAFAFHSLSDPDWLAPLAERGFFREPAPGIQGSPEVQCLARLAARDPEKVVPLLMGLQLAKDSWQLYYLARAASALPPAHAARLVHQIGAGLETLQLLPDGTDPLWDEMGRLLLALAERGQGAEALGLLKVQIRLRLEEDRWRPSPVLPEDVYRKVIEEQVPTLGPLLGIHLFHFLLDRLGEAVDAGRRPSERGEAEDRSDHWRPTIESSDQDREGAGSLADPRELLCIAARDQADGLYQADPACLPALLSALSQHRYRTFQRLALHLVREAAEADAAMTRRLLLDRSLFFSPTVHHEYWRLASARFEQLSTKEQQTLLAWMEEGPGSVDALRTRWPDLSDQDLHGIGEKWRLARLHMLREHLPAEWQARYVELCSLHGVPDHPDLPSQLEVVGPGVLYESPVKAEELSALSVSQIVGYLNSWRPEPGQAANIPAQSRRSLGSELGEVVRADPRRFAEEATLFRGLPSVYIDALLTGFAFAASSVATWIPVLELGLWIVEQGPSSREGRPWRDTIEGPIDDWNAARRSLNDLLRSGLHNDPQRSSIPLEARPHVWRILSVLCEDPDAGAAEPRFLENQTWQHVRTAAIENVVLYAYWLFLGHKRPADTLRGLAKEAGELLSAHLDPAKETAPAVWFVLGEWLRVLLHIDLEWTGAHLPRLFPAALELRPHWTAAWLGFLSEDAPEHFALLAPEYERAVAGSELFDPRPVERLGSHLFAHYRTGQLPLQKGGLLDQYLGRTPDHLCALMMRQLGRGLQRKTPDPAWRERLQTYWDWRLEHIAGKPIDHREELSAFGSWVHSPALDTRWALRRLRDALVLGADLSGDHRVAPWLVEQAPSFLDEVLSCFELAVEHAPTIWRLGYMLEPLRRVIELVIERGDPELLERAERLINLTGEKGSFALEDLLTALPLAKQWAALIADLSVWGAELRRTLQRERAVVTKIERGDRAYTLLVQLPKELRERYGLAEEIPVVAIKGALQAADLDVAFREVAGSEGKVDPYLIVVVGEQPDLEKRVEQLVYWRQKVPWRITTGQTLERQLALHLPRFDVFDMSAPIDAAAQLIGREEEVTRLKTRMLSGECTGLFGLRKVGKTSIARVVGRVLDADSLRDPRQTTATQQEPSALVVYLNLQGRTSVSEIVEDLHDTLRRRVGERPELKVPVDNRTDGTEVRALRSLLRATLAGAPYPLSLIFDECDYLFPADEPLPGLVSLLGTLHGLTEESRRLSVTLIGRDPENFYRPKLEGLPNPMIHWLSPTWIGALAPEPAGELLLRLGRRVGLDVDEATQREVFRWTGGHPYLHRQIGAALWNIAKPRQRGALLPTSPLLDEAITYFLSQRQAEAEGRDIEDILELRFPDAARLLKSLILAPAQQMSTILDHQRDAATQLRQLGLLYEEAGEPRVPQVLKWYGPRWRSTG